MPVLLLPKPMILPPLVEVVLNHASTVYWPGAGWEALVVAGRVLSPGRVTAVLLSAARAPVAPRTVLAASVRSCAPAQS